MQRQRLGSNFWKITKIKQTINAEQIQPNKLQQAQQKVVQVVCILTTNEFSVQWIAFQAKS